MVANGTISEVANGILLSGKDAELGILPSGTGGDFRRTLGIPPRSRDAAQILRDGLTRHIDVGRITFTNATRPITERRRAASSPGDLIGSEAGPHTALPCCRQLSSPRQPKS
ncbi:MAG: diacylglycerol/lipid kinase family protein [Pyrinomonadaceae bacterium]